MTNTEYAHIDLKIPLEDDEDSSYMERTHKVDLSFGIKPVAFIIADLVNENIRKSMPVIKREFEGKEYDSHSIRVETFPFYNCRESGIGISIKPEFYMKKKSLVICWSENKNSDDIVVYKADIDANINPPTLEDYKNTDFWDSKKYFECDDEESAAAFILKTVLEYNDDVAIEDAVKKNKQNQTQSMKI